jgi:hypothetical protein
MTYPTRRSPVASSSVDRTAAMSLPTAATATTATTTSTTSATLPTVAADQSEYDGETRTNQNRLAENPLENGTMIGATVNRLEMRAMSSLSLCPSSSSSPTAAGATAAAGEGINATNPTTTNSTTEDEKMDELEEPNDVGKCLTNPGNATITTTTTLTTKPLVRLGVVQEIAKHVVRAKLGKRRHLVLSQAIDPDYLDSIFPFLLKWFDPQTVQYNGGIAQIYQWKISCYLEVMKGGIPCTNPNLRILELFRPVLDTCNDLFLEWYRQQHACNKPSTNNNNDNNNNKNDNTQQPQNRRTCHRVMTFITRYTPAPGEQALLKVRPYVVGMDRK